MHAHEREPVQAVAPAPDTTPGPSERIPRLLLPRSPLGSLVRRVAGIRASVHAKLLGAFLLIALLLIAMGALSLRTITSVSRQSRLLDQARERVDASRQIEQTLGLQMNVTRNALLLRDDATIENILREKNRFDETLARLEEAASPDEREVIQRIRAVQGQVLTMVARIGSLIREGKHDEAMALHLGESAPLHREIATLVTRVVRNEESGMVRLRQNVEAANHRALLLTGGFAAASIVLALALGFVTSWSFILPVRQAEAFLARVAKGDFSATIDVPNRDEFGVLAGRMNRMSRELHQLSDEQGRLFAELEGRNREITEALEQQTATADILRAISGSPTDIQPVLDTVVRAAARFCGATDVAILRLDGHTLRDAAGVGPFPDVIARQMGGLAALEIPVTRGSVTGRAVVEKRTVHVHDLATEPEDEFPEGRDLQRRLGHHTMVATPLLREGTPLGVIALFRMVVDPFSDKQLGLLRVFADQAAIAIENVRLFTELETRNRDLTESLEQQTATSEILRIISTSPTDLQPVLETVAANAARLCAADDGHIWQRDGATLHRVASWGGRPVARQQLTIGRRSVVGRAAHDRAPVHVEDLAEAFLTEFPDSGAMKELGYRTILAVPLLREGVAIGVIMIRRTEIRPFTDKQIALVKTFADQAVIAIENVRLFQELETRNRDLTETLEQQTATGEILRVISSSPTDVQPVFDTIAQSAKRLCDAQFCQLYRFDGTLLHFVAHHGLSPEGAEAVRHAYPMAPGRASAAARSVLSGVVEQVPDVDADPDYGHGAVARTVNFQSVVGVPMVRDGVPIGSIAVARVEAGAFPDRQLELLKTFADQAVIAIENVRLFKELEVRNRDLTETLEQQTATSEILRVISSSPTDIQPVFDTIARSAAQLCEAQFCHLFRFDGKLLHFVAHHGLTPEGVEAFRRAFPVAPDRGSSAGRAALSGTLHHIPDVHADPDYRFGELARFTSFRSIVAVPMVREGHVIGTVNVGRAEAGHFSDRQLDLLKTFADQAVIAIENVRLFKELEAKNRDLTETLEQQTATGEILRVISSSPTDVQPVFDIIGERAEKLCDAAISVVSSFDGELLHLVSLHGVAPAGEAALRDAFPMRPDDETVSARAVKTRAVVHVADVLHDVRYEQKGAARRSGYRGCLGVPMVREGQVTGVIFVARTRPGLFTDTQVELLKTFADQAVIAIQNVRLFTELEARNAELTGTLARQTATGEVLRAISRAQTDAQPVFDIIAASALRLCSGGHSGVWLYDGELIHLAALENVTPEGAEAIRRDFPKRADEHSTVGRAILAHAVAQIPDVLEDPAYGLKSQARTAGFRSFLATPMLRDGEPIGVIGVGRPEPGPFPDTQVELLRTFADQAVIAIENVRLFTELEARNRDLTETLEQQTATGEILRVISSSPTDLQPVFDAIAARAMQLCGARNSGVLTFDGELVHIAALANVDPQGAAALRSAFPMPPSHRSASARAILTRAIVHIPDILEETDYGIATQAQAGGFRSVLSVPMLREGNAIGGLTVGRPAPGRFSERQIALLQTFAEQAVIAIENVRLFKELEARTSELTRSVGELKALGEVSQAVSSTLDLETVLETIVTRAVQLSGSDGGIVYEFEEASQSFHLRATHRISSEHLEVVRSAPIRLGEGAVGRAGVSREPVQVADIQEEWQLIPAHIRALHVREGTRALLAVPLVREGQLLGGLVIMRRELAAFSPEVVSTLQAFATQSVLAIHNAGLFREIQRRKQYADAIVETSPVAIVTVDLDGRVVGWNPGAEQLFGHTEAESLGRPMEDLVATPDVLEEVRANIRRTLAGEWLRAIGRRARKDGTAVDVEISSVPVVVDGVQMGMIGIYHDITDLLRARREAEAANEAKSAFLATMSHEIRTPLNAVIGMSGLLLNTPLADEQREYAEIVRQSGDALLTVINDILDFSKIEAGKLELEAQPFDLRECVEGALDLVAARATEKGLDLAYMVGDGTPAVIVGDVTRLRQVLLNLLSNAVKFTERGEVVLSVVAHQLDGSGLHELTFAVRDTGIGIPPDRLGRLFQSFSQVDASTTRRYGGTGLGLAISQRLTELMGGRISVTSEVGAGSEFRFTIRAVAAAEELRPVRRDLSGVQPSLRGKRVLVVDDNATNRRIVTTHLGHWGLPARATESPREALAWIEAREPFDVGILDMHMPEMDGIALARAIRQHAAGAELPLILFTSLGRREARAEEEGFAAYLHKPIKPSQLFDALVSVLADHPVRVSERGVARSELDPDLARRHPLRILLAEDNVVNQKVALRLLGQMGYRADVAGNGLEAIDAVERQAYDVVLMDVQMPELDGFEASREINRRWPGERRPRIVAMTANAMQGDRELCAAAGMDDYVAKPIRVEELVAALERCPRRPESATRGAATGSGGGPDASKRSPSALAGSMVDAKETLPASAPATAGVDRAAVERLTATMGAAFVAELIDTFAEDARGQIASLRQALAATDIDAFRRAAHSLKSTSETLGAMGLAGLARELEARARAGSLEGAAGRLERLADTCETVTRTLGELRHDLPA